MTTLNAGESVVGAWQRHNNITVLLVRSLTPKGLLAVPTNSRGRTVAAQLTHMHSVRLGWLHHHATGKRLRRDDLPPVATTRTALTRAFKQSGEQVAALLTSALLGDSRVRMFGGDPVRWFSYLVSHESHHRGQIALALKQSGHRLAESVAMKGLWGTWIFGK